MLGGNVTGAGAVASGEAATSPGSQGGCIVNHLHAVPTIVIEVVVIVQVCDEPGMVAAITLDAVSAACGCCCGEQRRSCHARLLMGCQPYACITQHVAKCSKE